MSYYRNEFDKRGFNTMFTFLQRGHQKSNIPEYKKAIQNLITMMNQKTSGKSNKDINWDEEFDMTIITIVALCAAPILTKQKSGSGLNTVTVKGTYACYWKNDKIYEQTCEEKNCSAE